jgi:uncharacterized membrane protein SirB2
MMNRLVIVLGCVGLFIPVVWMILYHQSPSFAQWWFAAPHWVETVRLVLWPSAILLMADPHDSNVALWVVSAVTNAALYAALASFVGQALRRRPQL